MCSIIIRVDSSTVIGTGHVMRCLTLADMLRDKGNKVSFICRDLDNNMIHSIEQKGYKVDTLPVVFREINENAFVSVEDISAEWEIEANYIGNKLRIRDKIDWIIVDHYALDYRWESLMRKSVKKIMVIDDLANRLHQCDILLDQNFYPDMEARYKEKIPPGCTTFLGPRYALLRDEFSKVRKNLKLRNGKVSSLLVFFGGSDPTNETCKVMRALKLADNKNLVVDVVIGGLNPNWKEIESICSVISNTTVYRQVNNMAELMNKADFAFGAGGITTWERCFLGLPSATITVAPNQVEVTQAVAAAGCTWYLGAHHEVTEVDIANIVLKALTDSQSVNSMSRRALDLMGGSDAEGLNTLVVALQEDIYA